METLMELVNEAEIEIEQKVSETKLNTSSILKELGFTKVSKNILSDLVVKEKINKIVKYKYLKITDLMINTYLDNKVKNYNKLQKKATHLQESPFLYGTSLLSTWAPITNNTIGLSGVPTNKIIWISKQTCDFYSGKKGTIGQFVWKECPIDEYDGVPPKEVLDKLRIHKDRLLFDYFTIASMENVKDPLLFGRLNNSADRYFIAQWGEDILLDDII